MADLRPFDDGRWPDLEGFADCFLCGRKIDPLDPQRGSYTANARAAQPLPAHLSCLEGCLSLDPTSIRLQTIFLTALTAMADANAKAMLRAARVSAPDPAPL